MFGLLPSRKNEIGTYVKDDQKGHLIVWLTSFTKVPRFRIDFPKLTCFDEILNLYFEAIGGLFLVERAPSN